MGRWLVLWAVLLVVPGVVNAQLFPSGHPSLPQKNNQIGFTSVSVCEPQGANGDSISKSRQGTACHRQDCGFLTCSASSSSLEAHRGRVAQLAAEEELIRSAFQEAFGLDVPKPAYFTNLDSSTGAVLYWTSTVYQDAQVLRVYVYPDGTFDASTIPAQRPVGVFRTISIAIDYGNTNIADIYDTLWAEAQQRINEAHAAFAREKGYPAPIVSFEFTNILVSEGEIADPTDSDQVFKFLEGRGITDDQYDLVNVLNLDTRNPAGGFAFHGGKFIHMGWFFSATDVGVIDQSTAQSLANATYGFGASVVWGWENEWSVEYESHPSLAWGAPVLMGWEDTDGDNIPEIQDPTPYGMGEQPTQLTIDVPATAEWVDTGLDVLTGDDIEVHAVGTWIDGSVTSGPDGSATPSPDNFLNLTDLGACRTCASTPTEGHGALIGYIGDSPPAAGSYTSTAVRSEAEKVFYIGANFQGDAPNDGRLWLNKNSDAYSGYTVDNTGSVTATIETAGPDQPPVTISRIPQGKAPNLVVLVHGCCTDENGVEEWDDLGRLILEKIPNPNEWEVVVWDWHEDTPRTSDDYSSCLLCLLDDANAAYDNAIYKAILLSTAISVHPQTYKYVHLIAHSAGAKLIDEAAKQIAKYFEQFENTERPFIHLTFLDAYTRTKIDSGEEEDSEVRKGYGYVAENYPHYSEHYVDDGPGDFADATLASAFNFDITGWIGADKGDITGHQWPRIWYTRSIEFPDATGDLGFQLSLEGDYEAYSTLSQRFEPGESCHLTDLLSTAICGLKLP
jgi:hypothetical protein